MKKYLFTSAAALAFCGLFTSCTHDLGYDESSAQNSVVKTYEQAFVTAFGQPDPNQEWGFGTSVANTRAMTRYANKPGKPTFRDGENGNPPIDEPQEPATPTFYKTIDEVTTAKIPYAGNIDYNNGWDNVSAAYIDANNNNIRPDRTNGKTFYVNGDVKYWKGVGNDGVTFVVLENSALRLGCVGHNMRIYLAANAKLYVTKQYNEEVISYYPYESRITEKDWDGVFTLEKSNAFLYLSERSEVVGNDLKFYDGCTVFNDGGTITANNIEVVKNATLWNENNVSVSNYLRFFDGCTVMNDGGTISAKDIDVDKNITLWNEGSLTATNDLQGLNDNAYIYNAANKTITISHNLSLINNYDLLYNDGTVNVSGDIYMTNDNAEIVNNNTLTCSGDFKFTAGGKFHNVGTATITGETYLYNTNSVWMNDGHFTTGTFSDQNCEQVYNNCYMTVTGTFHLGQPAASNGHSFFVLDGGEGDDVSGAYVKCANFIYGGNTDLFLGNKSFIEVTTEFKSANYNKGFGIHGPASGSYAVIKAPKVTKEGNPEESIAYDGKLYIDTPLHFEGGYTYSSSVQFSFKDEKSPVKIPKTDCNPGYGKDPEPDPSSDVIRVICEDLSVTQASDWDFNDAVFDVQLLDENKKVKITLLAAGGTLPLTVAGEEVHGKFQEFNPNLGISTGTMLSTGSTNSTGKYHYINCEIPYYIIDNIFGSTEIKEVAKAIPVQVQKLVNGEKTWVNIEWKKGAPTAKMAVGTDYNWCDERTDIRDNFRATNRGNEYPTFNMYVQGILEDDWYTKNTVNDGQAEAYIE